MKYKLRSPNKQNEYLAVKESGPDGISAVFATKHWLFQKLSKADRRCFGVQNSTIMAILDPK